MAKYGGSHDKRIKGAKLQALRLDMYKDNPCCNSCGRLTAHPHGYQIDHIKPLHLGGTDTPSNRQLLCIDCHEKKTAKEMGYTPKKTIGYDGWPIEG